MRWTSSTNLLLLGLCACLSTGAPAAEIFNNGGPDGGEPRTSLLNNFQTADDFTVGSATTVRSVTVFYFRQGGGTSPSVAFDVRIYNDVGGAPDPNAFAITSSGGAVLGTDTGVDFAGPGGGDIFAYNFDLATPVNLPAGGTYWFSPLSHDFQTSFWAHSPTGGGSFDAFRNVSNEGDAWTAGNREHAFILDDALIPEPASAVLLGLGGLSLLRRRWR